MQETRGPVLGVVGMDWDFSRDVMLSSFHPIQVPNPWLRWRWIMSIYLPMLTNTHVHTRSATTILATAPPFSTTWRWSPPSSSITTFTGVRT